MHHELKILPVYFEAVVIGVKTFEIRNNTDRDFQKGDMVTLKEVLATDPSKFTGREQLVRISYVTDFQQPDNQVVFGFQLKGKLAG